ncbi:T9SS type B sorting domain-containing protein [Flavobacterium sp. GCM10023249]|uniref:Ig-like domain-containing protein n=1 Tax=unclassified Flavobacterium TaxID=196869 RepID=UPI00361B87B7
MRKLLYLTLILLFSNLTLANTIFVNNAATGSNNGTSWINAYTDLQNAINNAADGDEIWVAKGTYFPTRPADNLNTVDPNNRKNSFTVLTNVKLYGGFIGNETLLNQRDWNTNQTILDGDIGNNSNLDNCYHVVILGNTSATLDGFIVQNGRADDFSNSFILIRSTALYADEGAGIASYAIVNSFKNLIVRKNYCVKRGGGIYSHGAADNNFDNLVVEENISNSGDAAGIFDDAYSSSNYSNLKIINNTSYRDPGGIYIFQRFSGNRYLRNLIVQGNTGGIYIDAPSATISNSLFTGNMGSAIYSDNANITLSHITVTGNNSNSMGAVHLFGNSHKVYNSILWGNSYPDITVYVTSTIDYKNNTINFGLPITATNSNQNPLFINPLPIGLNSGGDYRLSCGSQCIDAGNNAYIISGTVTDLDNTNRILGSATDMGAYEFNGTSKPITPNPFPFYCQNEIASALSVSGTNVLWYTTPTGGIGSTSAPTPNTSITGTTTYYVSQTVAGCESPRTAISVEVKAPSAMPKVTPSVNYCQNQTASALSATGTTLLWYTTSAGGTGTAIAPIPDTSIAGTTTYYVSQNTNGCESARAAINVIVDNAPVAPSVTPQITYCQNETPSTLTASGNSLLWYSTPTGGSGNTTAPIPNTSTSGTTTYYVTQTVGCESPRSAITVTVNAQPQSPAATSSLSYCLNETSNIVTATGTNLLWYTTPTGGTGSTIAPTPSTTTAGTTVYYVSQTIAGCESPRTAISVEVKAPSAMPTVTPSVNYCQNQTASALSATGTTLLWYTTSTGGTGTTIAPIPDTSIAGTTTYYVSQNTNGCESARAAISVMVGSAPSAPVTTSTVSYCQNQSASPLTATGSNLLWYSTPTGGTGSTTAPTPNTSNPGVTTYYVTQTVGCESQRSPIAVTIVPLPKPILAGGSICKDKNNALVPFVINTYLDPATYSFQWYSIQSGIATIIPNATQNNLSVTLPAEYGVITKDRSTTLGCESDMSKTIVNLENEPIAIAVTQSDYFAQQTSIKIEVLPAGNYNYQLDNGAPQSNNVFTNVKPGEHIITVTNACGSITENVLLVDYPKFFTPNGDGFTETWNIKALQDQPESRIEIFDRMGKLLKVIQPSGLGWDGTYNGKELPSTDYWFVVHYSDANAIPKTFKAHFTLKR